MHLALVHPRVLGTDNFTPLASKQGIPGSEETFINICKEFVRQGVKVTVFTQTQAAMRYGASLDWMPMELMSSERWFDCLCIWSDNPSNLKPWDQTLPDSASVCVRLVNQSNRENFDKILCSGKRIGLTQTDWFSAHNTSLGKYPLFRWNNGVYPDKFNHISDPLKISGKIF